MDLSIVQSIFRTIEETRLAQTSCGQRNNCLLRADVPSVIVENYKTILFQNPGKKVPELFDCFLHKDASFFFFEIQKCLLTNFDIWKDETSDLNSVVSLTKRLIDWAYDVPSGRLRLARIRKIWPQAIRWAVVARQEPHDFFRTQKRSRHELLHPDVLPKKLSFTVLHALVCMCVESIIDKPMNSFDNGLDDSLQIESVFANDMAVEKSVFDTVQYDMDTFAQTFSAQVHSVAAITRAWVEAMPTLQLQQLKMKFETKIPSGPKDTGVIQRNFLTQLALMWYYVKEIDHCCTHKLFNKLQSKLVEDAAAWAQTNMFLKCLDEFFNVKSFKMTKNTHEKMTKQGEILQQLTLRMNQIIAHMYDNRNLREKFISMDYWTMRLSTSNPQHSVTHLQNDIKEISQTFWGFGPDQWTSLSMEQFGIDTLEGSTDIKTETFEKNHPYDNVMALMGVAMAFTQSMEHLWVVLTSPDAWKATVRLMDSWKKGKENPIEVPLLQIFPDGSLSKKPSWMMCRAEMDQMRSDWKEAYNVAQQMKEDAILKEIL